MTPDTELGRGGRRGPGKALLGCGVGCLVLLVAMLVFGAVAVKRTLATAEAASGFVRAATAADPAAAYDLLSPVKQQQVPRETFAAQWRQVREQTGEVKNVAAGAVRMDMQRSLVFYPMTISGERGQATVEIGVNPNDRPVQVVEYTLPAVQP